MMPLKCFGLHDWSEPYEEDGIWIQICIVPECGEKRRVGVIYELKEPESDSSDKMD